MRHLRIDPRRCARAQVNMGGAAAQVSVASLFHDGAANVLLALLDVNVQNPTGVQMVSGFALGSLGTKSMDGVAMVQGDPRPTGQVFNLTQAAAPAGADYVWGQTGAFGPAWRHDYPLAFITPGNSWWAATVSVNTNLTIGFVWMMVYPEELVPIPAPDLSDY